MGSISEIVQQALRQGYLTIEAEQELRILLGRNCPCDDMKIFCQLQMEIMEGRVTQEAREKLACSAQKCL
ncbi:hypothetical protein K4A83_03850 [Spirulina subsalsa FACHB-351]|uniref:Uncharacterized protein n=1 Tax=Spirulina subsalsa FACHB-351 TaxID=234711 RepID=A0ABT3L349_9CYAN|nr:hypothetical protein [Spirulina subsalsa]MCW6035410.1 hypothetical protein [Spirulina subsalsa FACHB-351]